MGNTDRIVISKIIYKDNGSEEDDDSDVAQFNFGKNHLVASS